MSGQVAIQAVELAAATSENRPADATAVPNACWLSLQRRRIRSACPFRHGIRNSAGRVGYQNPAELVS